MTNLIAKGIKELSNVPGWRSKKNIVVFESDDWGAFRMPSLKVYEQLKASGLDVDSGDALRYNMNDTLEDSSDLEALFEVLNSFKDPLGNPAVFTALALCANPDFDKIRHSGFQQYFYESLSDSYSRYGHTNMETIWQQGIKQGLMFPEFHGREHLNVAAWMRALQNKDPETRLAFDHGYWGFNNKHAFGLMFQAAFDLEKPEDLKIQHEIIESGLKLFSKEYKRAATVFVPPNGPINNELEATAATGGIQFVSSSKIQREVFGNGITKTRFHYPGQKNKYGQHYLTRNAFFEPSQSGQDPVGSCLKDIEAAFRWQKPAVISTHRVNYIGGLREENRSYGLELLKELLKNIQLKWPETLFMSSDKLGLLMAGKNQ